MAKLFYRTAQVAALLDVAPRSVRAFVAEGFLPASKVGERGNYRFDPADVESLRRRLRASGPNGQSRIAEVTLAGDAA